MLASNCSCRSLSLPFLLVALTLNLTGEPSYAQPPDIDSVSKWAAEVDADERWTRSADHLLSEAEDSGRDAAPLHLADVSGDGVLDLIAAERVSGTTLQRVVVFVGSAQSQAVARSARQGGLGATSTPLFAPAEEIGAAFSSSHWIEWLDSADVDGDGDVDLLLATPGVASFRVLRNDGSGRFESVETVALKAPLQTWAVGDITPRDGIVDLIALVGTQENSFEQVFSSPHGVLPLGQPNATSVVRGAATMPLESIDGSDAVPASTLALATRGVTLGRGATRVDVVWPADAPAPIATQMRQSGAGYTVNNAGDASDLLPGDNLCDTTAGSAVCTFRAAVEESNATLGTQTIDFTGPLTISPGSGIVATGSVVIDATGDDVVLNGDGIPGTCVLQIQGGASTIRGMVFSGICVELETLGGNTVAGNYFGVNTALDTTLDHMTFSVFSSSNVIGGTTLADRNYIGLGNVRIGQGTDCAESNRVIGNYFGVRADGMTPIDSDAAGGVEVTGTSSDVGGDCLANEIGGLLAGEENVIMGSVAVSNTRKPVSLGGGRGTLVQGNMLGATVDGTAPIAGTKESGVVVTGGVDALIGGTVPAAANTIATVNMVNSQFVYGVSVAGTSSVGTKVQGNRIGTNAAGMVAISNFEHGVYIENGSDVTIGGTVAGAGNVIAGSIKDGVHIADFGLVGISRNVIAGNMIGVNATATAVIPNGEDGIELTNLFGNEVDTTVRVEANIIGGNVDEGIEIDRVGVTPADILIVGNFIGTNTGGTLDLGNGEDGVLISEGVDNMVGGTGAGAANTIAFNGRDGVRVSENSSDASGNTVSANSIYSNDGGGIGLSGGANRGQQPPELTVVFESPIAATGTLDPVADSETVLEFFANTVCDGSGFGEGRRYLGSATVASGTGAFSVGVAGTLATGEVVTATSTDADGNTSFFSDCITAASQMPIFSDGFESGSTSAWSSSTP